MRSPGPRFSTRRNRVRATGHNGGRPIMLPKIVAQNPLKNGIFKGSPIFRHCPMEVGSDLKKSVLHTQSTQTWLGDPHGLEKII
jgi:hypothetical protein